jgi:Sulfotransferase domain
MYALHLRKWFELFDRNQILVLSYDELNQHPSRLQERIESFLGVSLGTGLTNSSNAKGGSLKVRLSSTEETEALSPIFSPLNADLYQLLESNPGPAMEQQPFPRFHEP